jgi:hypothetical protein
MKALIDDARTAIGGVFRLMAFREDWRSAFDVSADGLVRSFAAVLICLPAYAFLVAALNHFVVSNPDLAPEAATMGLGEAALQYARLWLLFPLVAALVVLVLGRRRALVPWIVVHNWTVVALIHLQVLIWALNAAGLVDGAVLASLLSFYQLVRLFAHWRVALGALDVGPVTAGAAAAIPLIADWLVIYSGAAG